MQKKTGKNNEPPWQFHLSSISDLEQLASELNTHIDTTEDISILAKPVRVRDLTLPNSLAVHPMEGADGDNKGCPSKLTFRRYTRFASGGVGLIWIEATSVVPEGRANPRQLWINSDNKETFAELVRQIRQAAKTFSNNHKPVIALQLTHSGRYSNPTGTPDPLIVQHDPYRDTMSLQQKPNHKAKNRIPKDWPPLTDEYLDKLIYRYVDAARIAYETGFDAVDIKACHGYLINELLASHIRAGRYGGSLENRTRFLLGVIDKIRSELGQDKHIFVRLGVYDGIPYPFGWGVNKKDYDKFDLAEPTKLVGLLRQRDVGIINITAGNPYLNPHYSRPFNEPIADGYESPEHPLVGVVRLINMTGQVQRQFPDLAIVGTGYSWLRTLFANVAAASKANHLATIIGAGRMAFAYPDFARDIIIGKKLNPLEVCIGCSACTQIMRDGGRTGCVVHDNKIYGPIYKHSRLSNRVNLARLASGCRRCQEPTCQLGCPAGVNISKFIDQFLDGNEKGAYETIRQSNIFPEICAWLCPVEQQCVGRCLQGYIGDGPLPIADIQRYLAEQANENGWSRLNIPKKSTGRKIAIIGAGPAGLACAAKLLEAGHTVTIFDKSKELGGSIASAIPTDRFGDSLSNELTAIFKNIPKNRLILQLDKSLHKKFNLDSVLSEGFNAVFISVGLQKPITSSNKACDGLWNAMEFLSAAKQGTLKVTGKTVAIIGGGNTAMDSAVVAKDKGAQDVYLIYRRSFEEMPAWQSEVTRTLSKGVHFVILTQQLGYSNEKGRLKITVCPTILGKPDKSGRRKPIPLKDEHYNINVDIAVEALGQQPADLDRTLCGIQTADGLIKIKQGSFQTTRPTVFAGGDIVRGESTIVAAVADGMAAAKEIDRFVNTKETEDG